VATGSPPLGRPAAAALALAAAELFRPKSLTLLLSPSQRQSHELFRKAQEAYHACGRPVPTTQDMPTPSKLELANGSRIVGLPGREATIRSLSSVTLLVVDEASEVADDLYRSVRPMLAVSNGRLVLTIAPFGRRVRGRQRVGRDAAHQLPRVALPHSS
jgi:hypothetical protein